MIQRYPVIINLIIVSGIQIITWGLFKKVVVADTLAEYVNSVYNNVSFHTGPSFWIATYFFAFQIYCDFSGYSDIAIGSARVLGFDLMTSGIDGISLFLPGFGIICISRLEGIVKEEIEPILIC